MQQLLRLARWIDTLNEWVGRCTAWLALAMVAIGTWNVVGRFLGRGMGQNLSSNALIEAQWYVFDILFLLGAAYTLKHNEHVRVDFFYQRFSPRRRVWVDLLGTVLFLLPFCGMVLVYSWNAVAQSWRMGEMSPDPGGLPRYWIKSMILVGFGLLFLQGIAEAIKHAATLRGDLPLPEGDDGEL
ncbi:TRAP transporter small permease subunit [Trichothermofontia sp.]